MSFEDEKFPVGLRVLVVDDDTTCLKLVESLLKKCKYHVTTTNQSKEALRMLKENKNGFDIVITDVEMPDLDGIKLLQLVGLDMNLPVIMLSAYSDPKRVMQGIRNGACDYLVKPVRIQELQNIWQHVARRNKSIPQRPVDYPAGGSARPATPASNATQDVMHKGKSIEESSGDDNNDDDALEEGGRENEDPTIQKKPRLFWSVELHQKFVDAVNQLTPDKAFPKKILDLMNVEGLTREKVASHLQKYRIYLRKMNSGSNQEGNSLGGLGPEDAHIGPLGGGYGVYRSLAGPGIFPGIDQAGGMFGRLNTAAGLSLRGLSSSPILPNSSNSFGKFDPSSLSTNQNANLFSGVPKVSLFSPPNTSMMLNGYPPLNAGKFGMGGAADLPNWGTTVQPTVQPHSFAQNDPLPIFCGMTSSSLNTAAVAPTASGEGGLMCVSPLMQLEGASVQQQNEGQKSNDSGNCILDDPKLLCGSGKSSSEYLEDIVGRFF